MASRVLLGLRDSGEMVFYLLVTALILTVVWKAAELYLDLKPYLLPSPEDVADTAIEKRVYLWHHTQVTLKEALTGFAFAIIVGFSLGVLMASWKPIEKGVYPVLAGWQAVPINAVAPLFIIWLGFGEQPKTILAALIAFFPIAVGTFVGLKSTRQEILVLGQSMGLSWLALLTKVKLPGALPYIFGGIKIGVAYSVIGAIVGEFVSPNRGLGYVIVISHQQLNTQLLFAATLYLASTGIVLFLIVDLIEKLALPWHSSNRLRVTP